MEAERFWRDLKQRLAKFELELHVEKTCLLELGRFAAAHRARRGEGKPESFEFLGFTHLCSRTRKGTFTVKRITSRQRMQRKLQYLKVELRKRMHQPVPESARWLAASVRGHFQYYGVADNKRKLWAFRFHAIRLWARALQRRSQKSRVTWERVARWTHRWMPVPQITHLLPDLSLYVKT